jgi:hypothetical protein
MTGPNGLYFLMLAVGFLIAFGAGWVWRGVVERDRRLRRQQQVEFAESSRRLQIDGGRPTPRAARPGPPARQSELRIRTKAPSPDPNSKQE